MDDEEENNDELFNPDKPVRPISIGIICGILCFGACYSIWNGLSQESPFPPWFRYLIIIDAMICLAAAVGLWELKKWGTNLFIQLVIIALIFHVLSKTFLDPGNEVRNIAVIIGLSWPLYFLHKHRDKMS